MNPNTDKASFQPSLSDEWYAIQTRPRHEKTVANALQAAGVEAFLPLCPQVRAWSDRRKVVEFPLFPGYMIARTSWSAQARARIIQTNGVVGFVGPRKVATPIPVQQIEAVRCLMMARAQCLPHPYLTVGQRVEIKNGALQGLQGILVRIASDHSLVVSVDLIHRSVAIRLKGYEVESL